MVYAPQGQSGNFFNRQERNVRSLQLVEALTISKDDWLGQHVFKSASTCSARASTATSTTASRSTSSASTARWPSARVLTAPSHPEVSGTEFAVFAQDRWRVNDRLSFELGMRSDRRHRRAGELLAARGLSLSVLPEGRGILRGGFGKFAERTPLTVGAFTQVRGADVHPLRRGRPAARRLRSPSITCRRRRAQDAGEHGPDRRLGSAVRPPLLLQGGVPAPQRLACLHRQSRCEPRPADAGLGRRVEILGDRDDRAVSGERAPRPDRLLRALAQHARSERLRPVLRQLPQSDHPGRTRTRSVQPTCPIG